MRCFLGFLFILIFAPVFVLADAESEKLAALPEGTSVIDSRGIESFQLVGKDAIATMVEVKGQTFSKAARLQTLRRPEQSHHIQFHGNTSAAVKKGDALVAIFDARAVEPLPEKGSPQSAFVFELNSAPYTKSTDFPFKLTTSWRRYYVPFFAAQDYDAGAAHVVFRLGFSPQTIEIAGLQVLDFGQGIAREKLPFTPATYAGREPDASWRRTAAEKIEQIRKGDITVKVTDPSGKPVAGAKVSIRMKRHSFGWGSAVAAEPLLGEGPDSDRYRQYILENYNRAVLENDLKWYAWSRDPQPGLQAVAWLRDHHIDVRGHCLVWPGQKNLPSWIEALVGNPAALKSAVEAHIREEAGVLRGKVIEWDVVNEPFSNFVVQTAITDLAPKSTPDWIERHASVLSDFYRAARAIDPEVKLDINDYSILESGGEDYPHQDHYERTIRQLLADKAPLGGIGIQGHFNEDLTPVPMLWTILDRYAQFGLPIQITEFDVNTSDETLAADYTRDFLTAMFAHEGVSSVLVWGFWEKRHWIPNAAFYRTDWSPRPAALEWERLVRKEWWTNFDGVTDANGVVKTRGYLGDYEIVCGRETQSAVLPRSGVEVSIRQH